MRNGGTDVRVAVRIVWVVIVFVGIIAPNVVIVVVAAVIVIAGGRRWIVFVYDEAVGENIYSDFQNPIAMRFRVAHRLSSSSAVMLTPSRVHQIVSAVSWHVSVISRPTIASTVSVGGQAESVE